jgi:biotin-dependent carboxylase-like uncharacterized protein
MIEIVDPGPCASVQDFGRAGYAGLGVPRSGAFDRAALALANRLVGNRPDAAGIEVTFGGLHVRAHTATTVAVCGAVCTGFDWGAATTLPPGAMLRLEPPVDGVRSYLAVRGGVGGPAELGSRSTDTLSGLGPPTLRRGDMVIIDTDQAGEVSGATAVPVPSRRRFRVVRGPRDDWFSPAAFTRLTEEPWTVRAESNRIGIRLAGPRLDRVRQDELTSEPTLPGAIQVPPDGQPILFGPDAPVTGGYPVIAVVRDDDLDAAAQLRPGDTVTFT